MRHDLKSLENAAETLYETTISSDKDSINQAFKDEVKKKG